MAILQTFKEGSNHYFCSWWWERRTSPKIITCILFWSSIHTCQDYSIYLKVACIVFPCGCGARKDRGTIFGFRRTKNGTRAKTLKRWEGKWKEGSTRRQTLGILNTLLTREQGAWLARLVEHYLHTIIYIDQSCFVLRGGDYCGYCFFFARFALLAAKLGFQIVLTYKN